MLESGRQDISPTEAENIAISKIAEEPTFHCGAIGDTLKCFTRFNHHADRIIRIRNNPKELSPGNVEFTGTQVQTDTACKSGVQENVNCIHPEVSFFCDDTTRGSEKIYAAVDINGQDDTCEDDPYRPKLQSNRLLCRAICILKRIVNQFRPDIVIEDFELTATLCDLLKAIYEVIREDGFDKHYIDKVVRLLKCVECQLCGQGAGDLDVSWELRALQEVIQEKLCEGAVQSNCYELKETSQVCNTLSGLLNIIRIRDPKFCYESNHAKCKILEALTYIDSWIQFTNMGSKSLAKLSHILKNLHFEVRRQRMGGSDFAQTVQSFFKAVRNAIDEREFEDFQEKTENVSFLARVIVSLNSVLGEIKKDPVCSVKAYKWKILGLMTLAETALEAKHHVKYKLLKLANLLGCLKCELYRRNMAKQKIVKKIVEVEMIVNLKLSQEEPTGELQETPQLFWLLSQLGEMIQCSDKCTTILNCPVEPKTIEILKIIREILHSGHSRMGLKLLELLLDALECEVRIQGYEGKDIFELINSIQSKLEELEPEVADANSKMTGQKIVNALSTMKRCCAKFAEELNLFCEGDCMNCKGNDSSLPNARALI